MMSGEGSRVLFLDVCSPMRIDVASDGLYRSGVSSVPLTVKRVLAAFPEELPLPPVTDASRSAQLLLAAFGSLLMLALYLALLGSIAFLMRWWWFHSSGVNEVLFGRHFGEGPLFFSFPLLLGVATFVSLLVPLFPRLRRHRAGTQMLGKDEPELFAFVHRICDLQGAPRPDTILLAVQSRSWLAPGRRRFFIGRKRYALTLGMAGLAVLDTQQLASRVSRAVCGRSTSVQSRMDRFMDRMARWQSEALQGPTVTSGPDLFTKLVFGWLRTSSAVLRGLTSVVYPLHRSFARPVATDMASVRLVGPEVFEDELRAELLTDVTVPHCIEGLGELLSTGSLPEDLVEYTRQVMVLYPDLLEEQCATYAKDRKIYPMYPTIEERVVDAQRVLGAREYGLCVPAKDLLRGWDGYAVAETRRDYKMWFGSGFDEFASVARGEWEEGEEATE